MFSLHVDGQSENYDQMLAKLNKSGTAPSAPNDANPGQTTPSSATPATGQPAATPATGQPVATPAAVLAMLTTKGAPDDSTVDASETETTFTEAS